MVLRKRTGERSRRSKVVASLLVCALMNLAVSALIALITWGGGHAGRVGDGDREAPATAPAVTSQRAALDRTLLGEGPGSGSWGAGAHLLRHVAPGLWDAARDVTGPEDLVLFLVEGLSGLASRHPCVRLGVSGLALVFDVRSLGAR